MILFRQEYALTAKDSQTDVPFSFDCPEKITEVIVRFRFSPGKETSEEICLPAIENALTQYYDSYDARFQPMQARNFMPIKNLLTLSFDKDGCYLGNAHRWQTEQEHRFTTEQAARGFVPPETLTGTWNGMIHIHEILSAACAAEVIVEGVCGK